MSRIGIDIRNIGKKRTGDEVVFFNLTKSLAQIDRENEYLLFTDICDGQRVSEIENRLGIKDKQNFQIIILKNKNKFTWNWGILPQYLRKNPVDIYLTQYITPWFVPKKIKIVTIVHDISFNFVPKLIKPIDLFFFKTLIPISFRRADKIVGMSQFTHSEIINYYHVPKEKMAWVHNAISSDFVVPSFNSHDQEKVRNKYNLPDKFILYLGTLQPRKNLPTLIKAFSILKTQDKIGKTKLILAGGKGAHNYDSTIDSLIKELSLDNDVISPGYIDEEDKSTFMSLADIFCFPSLYEGFGIPILEAMAVNVPVIASNIPPHREVAGEAALFFDPQSPTELADKLKQMLEDANLRHDLINRGLAQVKNFSWEKTARRMLEIFDSLK